MHPRYAKVVSDLSMIVSSWCNFLRSIKFPLSGNKKKSGFRLHLLEISSRVYGYMADSGSMII